MGPEEMALLRAARAAAAQRRLVAAASKVAEISYIKNSSSCVDGQALGRAEGSANPWPILEF